MTAQLTKKLNASWKLLIPYRTIGSFFALTGLITLLASLAAPMSIKTLVAISYIVMDVILVYGFWKLRKWVVVLMGFTAVFLLINNIVRVLQGTQKISSALMAVLFAGAILLFSYLSRSYLNGAYMNIRVVRVFVVALILSQLLFIF